MNIAFLLVLIAQLCRFNLKLFTHENVHKWDARASWSYFRDRIKIFAKRNREHTTKFAIA